MTPQRYPRVSVGGLAVSPRDEASGGMGAYSASTRRFSPAVTPSMLASKDGVAIVA